MNELLTIDEIINRAIAFYDSLNIKVPTDKNRLAARSLILPQYANEYKQKFNDEIGDNSALATVGDAVCGAYLMLKEYNDSATKEFLTNKKDILTNDSLNERGKTLLQDVLFERNNDLDGEKVYATSFEAIIGFTSLLDLEKAKKLLDKFLV